MANETERPIEQLLRAYAKKRRAEAGEGFALHPANRRQLQAAVAERFGEQPSPWSRWSRWVPVGWPRLAWGMAVAGVLMIAAALWLPSLTQPKSEMLLARNGPIAQSRPTKPEAPRSPALAAPEPAGRSRSLAEPALAENAPRVKSESAFSLQKQLKLADKDRSLTTDEFRAREEAKPNSSASVNRLEREPTAGAVFSGANSTAAAPLAATAPPPAASSLQKEKAGQTSGGAFATGESAAVPATSAPALTSGLAAGSAPTGAVAGVSTDSLASRKADQFQSFADAAKLAQAPAVTTQRFARTLSEMPADAAHWDAAATPSPILKSFTLEQSGRDLRVVDSDGSVYTGYLEVADSTKAQSRRSAEVSGMLAGRSTLQAPARSRDPSVEFRRQYSSSNLPPTVPAYFFRVVGTNQTTKQPVVFSGSLLPATNPVPAGPFTAQAGARGGGFGGASGGATIPLPLPARISGTLTVGRAKTQIEATANGSAK